MGAPELAPQLLRGRSRSLEAWPCERPHGGSDSVFPRAQVRWALQERRLRVAYQPIVRLDDLQVVGHEALARLLTPQGATLVAERFIDAAASIGLEPRIDADITAQVMAAAARPGPFAATHGKLFMNCCSAFLAQPLSVELLARQHQGWRDAWPGTAPTAAPWILEITERNLDADPQQLLRTLAPLLDLGFELALDDFGSTHSAFPYLLNLPIRYLKFDQALVQAAATQARAEQVLRRLQDMAQDLNMITIAEGVETPNQLDCARSIGIHWAQGYLWGRAQGLPESESH
jgi:EAL domain-containing protein (putative c-di-GMP-specific phosphodiesterase class I)